MKFRQPAALDLRWTIVVVSIGVVLVASALMLWMSAATYPTFAR